MKCQDYKQIEFPTAAFKVVHSLRSGAYGSRWEGCIVIPPGALACSGTRRLCFFATDGLQALKVEGGDVGWRGLLVHLIYYTNNCF